MSITWLAPAALTGLVLVALPIAIHLLIRQQSRQVAFPSLRFLQSSHLSALRRRSVQDATLLTCRMLILVAAVAALAAPAIVTPSRQAGAARRVARAVVVQPGVDPAIAVQAAAGAFRSSVFSQERMGDAIAEAVAWLDDQPSAAREVVMVGTFQLGQPNDADLAAIPAAIGLRLISVESPPALRDVEWPVLRRPVDSFDAGAAAAPAGWQRISKRVRLDDDATTVSDGGASPAGEAPIVILAAAGDQALADAALRAALSAGVHWPARAPARMTVAWRGADETAILRAAGGGPVVRMDTPSPESTAASAVARAIADAIGDDTSTMEPVRRTGDQLARWQRAPGPPRPAAEPVDEGDRRWFWGAALALLAAEQLWRRRRRAGGARVEPSQEARVA